MVTSRTRQQSVILILSLGVLNALTPFTIDLYLPAFSAIARDLNSTVARVSLSVSIYFIGFAFGQIFYGPLLDRFGRKPPIYIGLLIYLAASIGCMTSRSIEMLLLFRFISALGGSAASVGSTTMVRDYFPPEDGAKIFSMLMLVLSVSPLLAPSVGSLITAVWSWRLIFGILSALAILNLLLVVFILPVAYSPDRSVILKLKPILKNFRAIFGNKRFHTYTLAGSFSFAGLFVYVAGSPAIFMDEYHVTPKIYGAIFAICAGGMIGGGQLNHLLVGRFGSQRVFRGALTLQVLLGLIFLLALLIAHPGVVGTTSFLFFLLICAGITYPNAAALALEPFSTNVGSASSLLGFLQLGTGAVVAALVGLFSFNATLSTAAVMWLSSSVGLWILLLNQRSTVR
jgi:DHA1 family bicyclomycin/chloramphenicol resistance-like MFS transporter